MYSNPISCADPEVGDRESRPPAQIRKKDKFICVSLEILVQTPSGPIAFQVRSVHYDGD